MLGNFISGLKHKIVAANNYISYPNRPFKNTGTSNLGFMGKSPANIPDACEPLCDKITDCMGFMFDENNHTCYFYGPAGSLDDTGVHQSRITSYIKEKAVSPKEWKDHAIMRIQNSLETFVERTDIKAKRNMKFLNSLDSQEYNEKMHDLFDRNANYKRNNLVLNSSYKKDLALVKKYETEQEVDRDLMIINGDLKTTWGDRELLVVAYETLKTVEKELPCDVVEDYIFQLEDSVRLTQRLVMEERILVRLLTKYKKLILAKNLSKDVDKKICRPANELEVLYEELRKNGDELMNDSMHGNLMAKYQRGLESYYQIKNLYPDILTVQRVISTLDFDSLPTHDITYLKNIHNKTFITYHKAIATQKKIKKLLHIPNDIDPIRNEPTADDAEIYSHHDSNFYGEPDHPFDDFSRGRGHYVQMPYN